MGQTGSVATSRPNWYWVAGAFAGSLVFPAIGFLASWLWLQAFPRCSTITTIYTGSAPSPDQILSGQITFLPAVISVGLKPSWPSLSLVLLSFFLGAVMGRTWQLVPHFSARVLAFGSGIAALLWTSLLSTTAFPLKHIASLLGPTSNSTFLLGWFTIFPFAFPFLCSLVLLAFSLLARSRPLLKTAA